jgi:hypothetical protein
MYHSQETSTFTGIKKTGIQKRKYPSRKTLIKILPILLIVLLAVGTIFLGYSYFNLKKGYDPQTAEFKEVATSVKSLINVSDSEELRVAKITEIDKLKAENAQFYKDAKNGQYLVVLATSQRVLIYDKGKNKIVNFSTYNIQAELLDETKIAQSEKPLNIEIRTSKGAESGIEKVIANQIKALSVNYSVVKYSATEKEYSGLGVVLLNSTNKPNMSQNFVVHVGTDSISEKLPDGEVGSNADVVLFIGKDVKSNK